MCQGYREGAKIKVFSEDADDNENDGEEDDDDDDDDDGCEEDGEYQDDIDIYIMVCLFRKQQSE